MYCLKLKIIELQNIITEMRNSLESLTAYLNGKIFWINDYWDQYCTEKRKKNRENWAEL